MTDPAGIDRPVDDVPATGIPGDDGSIESDVEDVPLTRNEAIERDAAEPDDLPARPSSDVGLAGRADPDGSGLNPGRRNEGEE